MFRSRVVILLGVLLLLAVPIALASDRFTDVPADHWAHDQINLIANRGITLGCGGGLFCPEANVTRSQMAVFLSRVLALDLAVARGAYGAFDGSRSAPAPTDGLYVTGGPGKRGLVAYSDTNTGVSGGSGSGVGVFGSSGSNTAAGVGGLNGGGGPGVTGVSVAGIGVRGENTNATRTGNGPGVYGKGNAEDGGHFISDQANGLFADGANVGVWSVGGSVGVHGGSTNGIGVRGRSTNGVGVYGENLSATDTGDNPGVYGKGNAENGGHFVSEQSNGVFAEGANVGVWAVGDNVGVHGSSSDGVGVRGRTTTGTAIKGEGNGASTTAVEVNNGALRMTGSVSPALVVTVTDDCCLDVIIAHPLANDDPNAIILVTAIQSYRPDGSRIDYNRHFGVRYTTWDNRWRITNMDAYATMPLGQKFNVLIIKR